MIKFEPMKKILLFILTFGAVTSIAQQKLEFKINGLKDTTVFLARYFGERLYYADTAESKNQTVIFNKKELIGGVYAVVCPFVSVPIPQVWRTETERPCCCRRNSYRRALVQIRWAAYTAANVSKLLLNSYAPDDLF